MESLPPPEYEVGELVHYCLTATDPFSKGNVLTASISSNSNSSIQDVSTGDVYDISPINITNVNTEPITITNIQETCMNHADRYPWVFPQAKATLYLTNIACPKIGFLIEDDEEWFFLPEQKSTIQSSKKNPTPLKLFNSKLQHLIKNQQLQQGWQHMSTAHE
eukprot:2924026-Ditylum_brightwellii.AAC.1